MIEVYLFMGDLHNLPMLFCGGWLVGCWLGLKAYRSSVYSIPNPFYTNNLLFVGYLMPNPFHTNNLLYFKQYSLANKNSLISKQFSLA